jgi:hypothetical protein
MEFDHMCPDLLCDEIINIFESDDIKKYQGGVGSGVNKQIKDSIDGDFDFDVPYQKDLMFKVIKIIQTGKNFYIQKCKELGLDKKIIPSQEINIMEQHIIHTDETAPQIQKTVDGGFFGWHSDFSPFAPRILAYILYLNDMENDTGGDTCFISGKRIKPKRGKLLIFPASLSYIHRGEVVKKGPKYIITSFSEHCSRRDPIQYSEFPFIVK